MIVYKLLILLWLDLFTLLIRVSLVNSQVSRVKDQGIKGARYEVVKANVSEERENGGPDGGVHL